MATKLKRLKLNEVSLVDRGANQHAHVTLFKRDTPDMNTKIEEATAALAKSVSEIVSGDPADVPGALEKTFAEYGEHLQTLVSEGIGKSTGAEDAPLTDKEPEMSEDLKKQLDEANESLAKANKELAFAKMSDAHKAHATEAKLEGEALDAFVAKTAEERDAHIESLKKAIELPADVQKKLAEAEDLKKRLAAVEEANAKIEFAKKATDLGLAETDGEALRKAYAGDKGGIDRLVALIKGLAEQVKTGKLFEEFGTKKGADTLTAKARVDAVVAEMQAVDKSLTRAKAIEKIATDKAHAELWASYKAE